MGYKNKMLKRQRRKARRLGQRGERTAAVLLREMGWEILDRNYGTKHGEIDIVARSGDVVVFVEVKTRRKALRARPGEAVGHQKRENLTRAARQFLREIGFPDVRYRFDIVELLMNGIWLRDMAHYPNAFREK